MKYPLTDRAKAAARDLVEKWNKSEIPQYCKYGMPSTIQAGLDELDVQGILKKEGYPSTPVLRELEKFNLVQIRTDRVTDRTFVEILLLQELRNAVENDFEVSNYYRPEGGPQMVRCSLSDRQKGLIRSIVPGLKDGTIKTEWTVQPGDGSILTIFGIDDEKLQRQWREKVRFADFATFEQCGFLQTAEKNHYFLFEQAIIDAVQRNFTDTPVSGTIVAGDQYNVSGDFSGANVNIHSTLNRVVQTVSTIPHARDDIKRELSQYIEQLNTALQEVPQGHEDEVEAVADSAKDVVEALNKPKINRDRLRITSEGLEKAAKSVANITPNVLIAAMSIINLVKQFWA